MAQLDVRPKRKGSLLIWIIFAIIALGVVVLLYRGCNKSAPLKTSYIDTISNDVVKADTGTIRSTQPNWNDVDFNIPVSIYQELTDSTINIKANNKYTIYTINSASLFATDKTTLKASAHEKLNGIASSINKRYKSVNLGIFSYKKSTNRQLDAKRIDEIKDWFIVVGEAPAYKLSTHFFKDVKGLSINNVNNNDISIVAYINDIKQ